MVRFLEIYFDHAWHIVNVSWIEDVKRSESGYCSLKLRHEEFYHPISEDQYGQIANALKPQCIGGMFEPPLEKS